MLAAASLDTRLTVLGDDAPFGREVGGCQLAVRVALLGVFESGVRVRRAGLLLSLVQPVPEGGATETGRRDTRSEHSRAEGEATQLGRELAVTPPLPGSGLDAARRVVAGPFLVHRGRNVGSKRRATALRSELAGGGEL